MEIHKNVAPETYELQISGRVDGEGASRLDELLSSILFPKRVDQPDPKTIYVNLSNATFLSSAGLRVLMQHFRTMKNRQGQLLVSRPSRESTEALKMAGLYDELVWKEG